MAIIGDVSAGECFGWLVEYHKVTGQNYTKKSRVGSSVREIANGGQYRTRTCDLTDVNRAL